MIYNSSGKGLDDLKQIVNRTVFNLRKVEDQFDFIAVRGCSGMLVGAPVSLRLNKPLVVVRKPDEKSHNYGSLLINEQHAHGRYIFLDDFISSGATRREVRKALSLATEVGSCEYAQEWDWKKDTFLGRLLMTEDRIAA